MWRRHICQVLNILSFSGSILRLLAQMFVTEIRVCSSHPISICAGWNWSAGTFLWSIGTDRDPKCCQFRCVADVLSGEIWRILRTSGSLSPAWSQMYAKTWPMEVPPWEKTFWQDGYNRSHSRGCFFSFSPMMSIIMIWQFSASIFSR